jgi:hypothetical protein
MDSGILMIQDSILVCSPDPRIPHTAQCLILLYSTLALVCLTQGPYTGSQPLDNVLAGSYQYSRLSLESEIRPLCRMVLHRLLLKSSNHVVTLLLCTSVNLSVQHTPVVKLLFICTVYTFPSQVLLLDSMKNHNHHFSLLQEVLFESILPCVQPSI